MRNFIDFLIKKSSWIWAILLTGVSLYLVFTQNSYQRSVYLTSANRVTGEIYKFSNQIVSYVHMQQNNRQLLEENARLHNEVETLKNVIAGFTTDSIYYSHAFANDSTTRPPQFDFIPATVVNKSISGVNNFLTLDKGILDGVKSDMGVISQTGIVGVVFNVSDHFSVVIPVVNPKFRVSAKIKNSENSGSLGWSGPELNIAQLEQLPKHEPFHSGDTVVTSYSRIFPKDLVIGYTVSVGKSKDDNFNSFNIELASDFHSLQHVMIIRDRFFDEQSKLEESISIP